MVENKIYTLYVNPVYSVESIQTLKNKLEQLSSQPVKILELYLMFGDLDGLDFFGLQ
jgi:hypothetical protein